MTGLEPFTPLPRPLDDKGRPRTVGAELEFGGLPPAQAAQVVAEVLGGQPMPDGPDLYEVTDTGLGTFKIELDTALKADGSDLEKLGRSMARPVIPVELVCPPVEVEDLHRIDALARALADAGAEGTKASALYAYGMHYNISCVSLEPEYLWRVMSAFAYLEDYLREGSGIDFSRRALPFVDPYPRAFVDALAEGEVPVDGAALARLYLAYNPTRNRALDMTVILAMEHRGQLDRALGPDQKVNPRPTFHFRLPDCRLDEPGWTMAQDWNRWVLVERVAEDEALLEQLAADWRHHRHSWTTLRGDWAPSVAQRLEEAGL
ncbi:amidoligase family protein [Halovulum sp. GXIMD14794]